MRPHLPAPLAAALPHVTRHGRTAARWTLRALLAVAVLVVLLVAAVLYVLVVGIDVDAGFLRQRLAADMGAAIGREVRFEGPATLTLSARPKLRVGGLEIADPGGFSAGTLAHLGEARLALDLWQLVRKRLRVDEMAGADVKLRLVRGADGSGNWALALGGTDASPAPPPADASGTGQPMSVPPISLDLARLTLERIAVEYVTPAGTRHWFDLDSATGESPATGAVKLALKGRVEKAYPYSVVVEGAPLAELISPAHPWPFTVQVDFLGTALALRGAVQGTTGEVQFGVGTENLEQLERLLQTTLPKVGITAMAGRVRFAPGSVALEQFTAIMGRTSAAGELAFDERSGRRRISGRLDVATLDLRPFLSDAPTPDEDPASLRDTIRELSAATFSLKALRDVDVDVALAVDRWLSLPGDVRNARLAVKLDKGRLTAPMSASITGVALEGAMDIDAAADPPRFAMRWGTRDSDLGGLADLLLGLPGVQGRLGRLELRVAASGDQGSELVQSLDAALDVDRARLSYGNVEGGTPVQFDLERFALRLPAGKPLSADLRGALLGKPLTATLRGGSLAASLAQIGTPIALDLRSGPVSARLEGRLQEPGPDAGPDLRFSLSAPRADLVARWLGLNAGSDAPIALSGRARMNLDAWRLEDFEARVGRTRLAAGLSRTGLRSAAPLVTLSLVAEVIDVAELSRLAPPPAAKPKSAEPSRPVLQIPILPRGVDLTDADVTVRVKQVAGAPLDPRDIAFDGRIREGAMQPSSFSMRVADTPLRGAVSLDLRGETPGAALWLFAEDVDVGRILRQLDLARDLDARVDALRIFLQARASLLGDMLAQSSLVGNVEGGRVTLRDPNTKAQVRIALEKGELRADPGKPVRLDLAGAIDDTPVKLELETAPAAVLVDPARPIPFRFAAEAARTRVALNGSIARPLGGGDIELELDAGGPSFDALDTLTRTDLPPWGPWRLAGRLRITASGYEVPNLSVEVGSSRLDGRGRLDTTAQPPRIDVALSSPRIQLDDFRLGEWSPVEKKPAPADEKSPSLDEIKAKAREASNEAQKMLSPAVLRKQDAFLTVKVDQVLSGPDRLGSGSLEAKLEKGRATLGPAVVNVPGGSAEVSLYYEPTDTDVKVGTRMRVERFDYGILARRLKPGADLAGRFSLKVDVDSKARYLADILRFGSGRIDFAVWPENMKSGVIDLWAVNLLVALAPAVDGGNVSKVNCAVGRFVLDQGRLAEKVIVMDTSRMRVSGRGGANFNDETLKLRMTPQAKEPQFLSLALPIEVGGTFQKFSISPTTADVLGMVGRLATSIVWVPIQKLTGKKIPADGADVCTTTLPD